MLMDGTDTLVTRTGLRLFLRPIAVRDAALVADVFREVSAEDLRFRFFAAARELDAAHFATVAADPDTTIAGMLVFDEQREPVACATVDGDDARTECEVAIMVRAASRGRGIGWTLLDYLVGYATTAGFAAVTSIEDRANHDALALQQQMGFAAERVVGEPALVRVRRPLR